MSADGLLAGRRVLVVGAGTRPSAEPDPPVGNGRAVALTAAREGASVVCADVSAEAAGETARLVREGGGRAGVVVGDVADEVAVASMVAEAAGLWGGVDAVVCNAGIGVGYGLAGTAAADWDRVLGVNLRGPFLVARAVLPLLGEGGSVVFVGSLAGVKPGSRSPSYDASKAGLAGLMRHVAAEGAASGVRANVVAPGLIDTVMGRDASAGNASRGSSARLIPLGRQGSAFEVAEVVVFLLSSRASYVTGQVVGVDGGLSTLR